MRHARFAPATGLNARVQGRFVACVALLSALVASLTVVMLPRPAAADEIATLKAQAKTISQELIQDQLQIGAYQQQYSVASQKVAADNEAVAQLARQVGQDRRRIDTRTVAVRQLAITSYMDSGGEMSGSDAVFTGNVNNAALADEYTQLSAGNIDTALDQLQGARHALQTQLVTLQQQQTKDQADEAQQAADLAQSITTTNAMASQHALVTGQLAAAVAKEAAAQSAAAAAAIAAAQKAAHQPALTVARLGPPSIADPVLPPYLRCVVQAESGGNYGAVSPSGTYMGAFQFSQATWNMAARAAGLSQLVGVPPNLASKAEQDAVAVALYAMDGEQPWLGDRCR